MFLCWNEKRKTQLKVLFQFFVYETDISKVSLKNELSSGYTTTLENACVASSWLLTFEHV